MIPGTTSTLFVTQQTRDIGPVLIQCWANVVDVGPALNQHRVSASWKTPWNTRRHDSRQWLPSGPSSGRLGGNGTRDDPEFPGWHRCRRGPSFTLTHGGMRETLYIVWLDLQKDHQTKNTGGHPEISVLHLIYPCFLLSCSVNSDLFLVELFG